MMCQGFGHERESSCALVLYSCGLVPTSRLLVRKRSRVSRTGAVSVFLIMDRTAYSLVATDLDGTLFRGDDTVSDRSLAALARVAGAGARHLVVTGRPAPRVRPMLDRLGCTGLVVCGQGAQVWPTPARTGCCGRSPWTGSWPRPRSARSRPRWGRCTRRSTRTVSTARRLIEPGYLMPHPTLPGAGRAARRAVERADQLACRCAIPSCPTTSWRRRRARWLGSPPRSRCRVRGRSSYSRAASPRVTGSALAAERLGVSRRRTIAFGDMPNDIPMFDWAAHGVASARAPTPNSRRWPTRSP